jgi:hypothetical protein
VVEVRKNLPLGGRPSHRPVRTQSWKRPLATSVSKLATRWQSNRIMRRSCRDRCGFSLAWNWASWGPSGLGYKLLPQRGATLRFRGPAVTLFQSCGGLGNFPSQGCALGFRVMPRWGKAEAILP